MKTTTRFSKLNQHLEKLNTDGFTTEPAQAGKCSKVMPEFGRFHDVEQLFGLKRPTVYNLIAEGLIKSVTLRRKGTAFGVRLIYLPSVSEYLHKLMDEQNGQTHFDPQI